MMYKNDKSDEISKKNDMIKIKPLTFNIEFITLDLKDFHEFIGDVIYQIADGNRVSPDSLIFKTNEVLPREGVNRLEDVVSRGIPYFDYFIHKSLPNNLNIKYEIDTNMKPYSLTECTRSLFYLYFMIMTRAKCYPNEGESVPKFLTNYLRSDISYHEMMKFMSLNDLNKMNHSWIRKIDLSIFNKAIRQRLSSGIAGCRLFNIFKTNKPSRLNDLPEDIKQLYFLVEEVARKGPFFEMHPFFMPMELANISMSKNLFNLILRVYSNEELKKFKMQKQIFDILSYDARYENYLNWNKDTFSKFKSKITGLGLNDE